MHFSKTTARAIAFSAALVAAGATVAGAAVFQLPILGFGHPSAASAAAVTARRTEATPHAVRPKVVIKIRVVDDVVHRPAPRTFSAMRFRSRVANRAAVVFSPPPTTTTVTAPIAATAPPNAPAPRLTVAVATHHDDGHDHPDASSPGGPSGDGGSTGTPAADR